MHQMRRLGLLAVFALFMAGGPALGWGRTGHMVILRSAVQALPAEMRPFFLTCREHLAQHADEPDLWREQDAAERNRHYFDMDLLSKEELDGLPRSLPEAYARLGRERLDQVGVLPWRITEFAEKLTEAFRRRDWAEVRRVAPALSHYIADAHVPFHATKNYDGQLTGNRGIHGRFDIELVERYLAGPLVPVTPTEFAEDIFAASLKILAESLALVPACLKADTEARTRAPLDSEEYFLHLYHGCGEIARRRMILAAQATASTWYAAWLRAGRPTLPPEEVILILAGGATEDTSWMQRMDAVTGVLLHYQKTQRPYDAVAVRLTGPKSLWTRGVVFVQCGDIQSAWQRMRLPAGFLGAPLGSQLLLYEKSPPAAAELAAVGITYTPSLVVGIREALEALVTFPQARRRLLIVTDSLAREKELEPAVLGSEIAKRGIRLECYRLGEVLAEDTVFQALAKAAGASLHQFGQWGHLKDALNTRADKE